MTTTIDRALAAEERKKLEQLLVPERRKKPVWTTAILVAVPATFALFALLDLVLPVPEVVSLLLAAGVGGWAAWTYGKKSAARHAETCGLAPEVEELVRKDLGEGRAAVSTYEAEAVVRVGGDPSRFVGTTWFVKLADGTVVLLVQPDLAEAEARGDFPATAFEIATGASSHFVVSVKRTGERLAPVECRTPLSDAEWEELGEDADEPVPLGWEEVLERARANRERGWVGSTPGSPTPSPEDLPGDAPPPPSGEAIRPK